MMLYSIFTLLQSQNPFVLTNWIKTFSFNQRQQKMTRPIDDYASFHIEEIRRKHMKVQHMHNISKEFINVTFAPSLQLYVLKSHCKLSPL